MNLIRPTIQFGDLDNGEEDLPLSAMAWAVPQHSRSRVDAAGKTLVAALASEDAREEAQRITNNWRSSHSFPLNTFQIGLRRRATLVDANAIIAQRIKRMSSIEQKLARFPTMKLSQMQDLGGCRAIVKSVRSVDQLVRAYRESDIKHHLHQVDDYIRAPKESGYRGIHLMYRYVSDKTATYTGLKIEMQLRSSLQHAWATAVETVGTFIRQALKSSQGEEEWLRFFALMGSAIALREKTPLVPGTPQNKVALKQELRAFATGLQVEPRLKAYGAALQTLEQPGAEDAKFFLLALDPGAHTVSIDGFKANELETATNAYLDKERALASRAGAEAVLVSVESLASLRRAYPNYFLDTGVFISAVKAALA
jgi:hypothetical protein